MHLFPEKNQYVTLLNQHGFCPLPPPTSPKKKIKKKSVIIFPLIDLAIYTYIKFELKEETKPIETSHTKIGNIMRLDQNWYMREKREENYGFSMILSVEKKKNKEYLEEIIERM